MSTNPYLDILNRMTPEQRKTMMDEVLGPYVGVQLTPHEATRIWHEQLCHMLPMDSSNSLHVLEEVYEFDGKRYSCYWALDDQEGPPGMIEEKIKR